MPFMGFFPQEAFSEVISVSLCEHSNWRDLELQEWHIVALFWIISEAGDYTCSSKRKLTTLAQNLQLISDCN